MTPYITNSVLDIAQTIVDSANNIKLASDVINNILTTIDTAIVVNSESISKNSIIDNDKVIHYNKTRLLLQDFTKLIVNNMVEGQIPYNSIQNSFKISSKVVLPDPDLNNEINVIVPLSDPQIAFNTIPSIVNIIPNTTNTVSISIIETIIAQYLEDGKNFNSNPINVILSSNNLLNTSMIFIRSLGRISSLVMVSRHTIQRDMMRLKVIQKVIVSMI